jgi:hypothetical protein
MFRKIVMRTAVAVMAVLSTHALAANVAEGNWINLFDGETTFGWIQFGDVDWKAGDGLLSATAEKGVGAGGWLASTSQFKNFEFTAEVKLEGPGTMGIAVRAGLEGHVMDNGGASILVGKANNKGKWQTIHVKAVGSNIEATVDGKDVDVSASRDKGYVLIQFHRYHRFWSHKFSVDVRNVKLRPLGLTPIFNGKNLDGWNIIEDRASVFTVKDGAINIENGNGQIETVQTFKDMVLQLDIKSNGEHLNSGVFFRGPVGVFWKGYESQVRNQWKGDDRTDPVDYGTGGNYGNVVTRKVIPTDGEWFQKTVIAEGNHTSVWINGYQVSDFYDSRPTTDNSDGKNGYVPGPGTIHLQGHDPKTNLDFKNINVQEY